MGLNTDSTVVAVEAGNGLKIDDPATFGGTVTLEIDATDASGQFLVEDENGDLALDVGQFLTDDGTGSLTLNVGDGLSDDGSGNIEVSFPDGQSLPFGTDKDVGLKYNSSSDSLRVVELNSSTERIEFEQNTGSVNITGSITEGASL
jgi:hypothetical protein